MDSKKYLNYYYKVYGQPYTVLRFANVYGPRQYKGGEAGVVSIFIDNAVNGRESIINGDGLQTRDYVYVADVVAALVKAMTTDYVGALNISTGVEKNLLDITAAVGVALGKNMAVKQAEAKLGEQRRSCLDNKKAGEILNWQPQMVLAEGIKNTIVWSKNKLESKIN